MKIGIIGCGNMGSAIARRLASQNDLILYDRNPTKIQHLAQEVEGKACSDIKDFLSQAEVIILAVKPKDLATVSQAFAGQLRPNQLLISCLAGISTQTLRNSFENVKVVRMMPNLAIIYGAGVVGVVANEDIDADRKKQIDQLFARLGLVKWIPEGTMDALTSLTGSGPAFAFVMIEAMIDAAVAMGFNPEQGRQLVIQMLAGSLKMLQETQMHPGDLKWLVTSPAGTTIAGLRAMEAHGVRSGIIETFIAAFDRAKNIH